MRPWLALIVAVAASLVLVGAYRAAGGGSYAPHHPKSPCAARHWGDISGLDSAENELALSALDGAACTLHVSAADLALGLADSGSLRRFQAEHGISNLELAAAAKDGVVRAFSDGERSGAIDSTLASILEEGAKAVPESWLVDQAKRVLGAG
jgi:hypothetical protein